MRKMTARPGGLSILGKTEELSISAVKDSVIKVVEGASESVRASVGGRSLEKSTIAVVRNSGTVKV